MNEKKNLDAQVLKDRKLHLQYDILSQIGEGCFGKIYKAVNRSERRQVALKIEVYDRKKTKKSPLTLEMEILDRLRGVPGVVQIYNSGRWDLGNYIEMELLSSSLNDEVSSNYTEVEIRIMASEILSILKRIHAKGVVHQDLKPHNIMRDSKGSLVLIDFGLSCFFTDQNPKKKTGFAGTPRYASLAAHKERLQRPKDDVESLLYVLGFLYKKTVPWFQLKVGASERLKKIETVKQMTAGPWFQEIGNDFFVAYNYIIELNGNEDVDYSYLINLFQQKKKSENIKKEPDETATRRKSETFQFSPLAPTIIINYAYKINEVPSSVLKEIYSKEQNPQKSRGWSFCNFSEMAQDSYKQLIELITNTILPTQQESLSELSDGSEIVCSQRENNTSISLIEQYTELNFKNPFYN